MDIAGAVDQDIVLARVEGEAGQPAATAAASAFFCAATSVAEAAVVVVTADVVGALLVVDVEVLLPPPLSSATVPITITAATATMPIRRSVLSRLAFFISASRFVARAAL